MNPVLSWESDSVSESSGLRVRSAVAPVSDGDLAKEGCDSSPICISAKWLGPGTGDCGFSGCLGKAASGSGKERSGVSVTGITGVSGSGNR